MNRLILLALVFAPHLVFAQEKLFKFPSGPVTWTINCEQKAGTAAAPKTDEGLLLKRIEVAQTDAVRRSIIHWSNNQTRELWSLSKLNVIVTEDPSGRALVSGNILAFGDPFNPSNFDWINPAARDGDKPVPYDGKECYHYKGIIKVPDPSGRGAPIATPCEAWIDSKTLLPVALLKGEVLGRFSFGALSGSLEMPEKFRERLTYYKATMGIQN
jgi:hypothetical protein